MCMNECVLGCASSIFTFACAHPVYSHSYDVPETIAATIVGGNAAYLAWVADNVKQ
eukprot:m.750710 g.750710  ORF g.750710 m.750710 type:complete len:56 (-) comp23162_c0_seq12:505-672(-)